MSEHHHSHEEHHHHDASTGSTGSPTAATHSHEHGCGCCHHDHSHGASTGSATHDHDEGNELLKLIFACFLFALGFGFHFIHTPFFDSPFFDGTFSKGSALSLVFCMAAYIACGKDVVIGAIRNIGKGQVFDEEFLMTVASIAAVCIGEYPEAVGVMLFYCIGEYFQDKAVDSSRDAISALTEIRSDHATVIRDGKEIQIEAEDVKIGEKIVVKPGERVPLDGVITEGESFVDTSALTGESVPRKVTTGDEVMAGFVNTQGVIFVEVTKDYGKSAVARILELTENAADAKTKSERFVTRFSRVYTPIVVCVAVLVAVVPTVFLYFFGGFGVAAGTWDWNTWVYRAIIFLVVSCPCALVISVPLSFFAGIGAASKAGILVKGSNYLEGLSNIKVAVFDKTGTLTKGVFNVSEIHIPAESKVSENELVTLATHAEYYCQHPISKSLKTYHTCPKCLEGNLKIENPEEWAGLGLKVVLEGETILAGNEKLMKKEGVAGFHDCEKDDFGTIVHIARENEYLGHIVIRDEIKEDSVNAIQELKKLGVKKTVMLTGDAETVAEKIGDNLKIDEVHSELLPEGKISEIEKLLKEKNDLFKKGNLVFLGDGVNDAPVLARSDIGIAMGALGSDAAVEAADVVIMDDKISRLADGMKIAKKTVRIVNQNIVFSLGVKVALMVLGAMGIANMWLAVFGDVGVCFLAILNSLRVRK